MTYNGWYAIKLSQTNRDCIETQFLPSSGRVDTAIWMHYMDAN